jgi:hypothetical protein
MRKFIGTETVWFFGVVEDINDPSQLGRVRVRCYGWHTEDKGQISTDSLPWAIAINPTTGASVSGIGDTQGLLQGSWVFGIFIDGTRAQEPMILGSIAGAPSALSDTLVGFNDPDGEYPTYIDESDVNRLARGTQTKSYTPDSSIGEPNDPYNAQYPYNSVMETRSGHVKEYDDTPDSERIRELHKSGTFYQVHPDGTISTHIVRDRYTVVANDDSIHVSGDVRMIIDGNWDVDVTGDITIDGRTINLNNGTKGAARIDDTADTGDDPAGISAGDGSNKIETGSGTVFIGD